MTDIISELKTYQSQGGKLVIFCAGLHGVEFYEALKTCGISVDFFSDRDERKWDTIITDDVKCIPPETLRDYKCKGFICVSHSHYKEVFYDVNKNDLFTIIEISDLADYLINKQRGLYFNVLKNHAKLPPADVFYDLNPNGEVNKSKYKIATSAGKIAIYTAIFGNYDEYILPQYFEDNLDYYCISDEKPTGLKSDITWIDARTIIPSDIDTPIKRNRYVKMHPHLFFKDYSWSIYMDGNVSLISDASSLILDSKSGISVFSHPSRECVYYEALSICNFKRVDVNDVCRQMQRYFDEGMPIRYGLMEMPVIAREHNRSECIKVMETWWEEFNNGAQRDQLSFMYAMWKNGMGIKDLACLGNAVRHDKRLIFHDHAYESKNVKNNG